MVSAHRLCPATPDKPIGFIFFFYKKQFPIGCLLLTWTVSQSSVGTSWHFLNRKVGNLSPIDGWRKYFVIVERKSSQHFEVWTFLRGTPSHLRVNPLYPCFVSLQSSTYWFSHSIFFPLWQFFLWEEIKSGWVAKRHSAMIWNTHQTGPLRWRQLYYAIKTQLKAPKAPY